jgi:hypothetical protein
MTIDFTDAEVLLLAELLHQQLVKIGPPPPGVEEVITPQLLLLNKLLSTREALINKAG